MTTAFYVLALSVFALALSLFRSIARTKLPRVAILLLCLASCGMVVMGIFPGDAHALHPPATITGVVHWTAAGISFLSIMIAAFLLSSFFKIDERLQRFQRPCFLLALAMYGGPFCQDKKSACVKIQNPPLLLTKNVEGQVRFIHAPLHTLTVSFFGLLLNHCSLARLAKIDGSRSLIVQRLM